MFYIWSEVQPRQFWYIQGSYMWIRPRNGKIKKVMKLSEILSKNTINIILISERNMSHLRAVFKTIFFPFYGPNRNTRDRHF